MDRIRITDPPIMVGIGTSIPLTGREHVRAADPKSVAASRVVPSQRINAADTVAALALVFAAIAAVAGLLVVGLYRDTAEAVRQAQATDLVTIAVGVPLLGLSLWRSRSGSAGARLVMIGALGYLAYTYAIYAFSVIINPVTPIHIAILGLSTWSLVLTILGIQNGVVDRAILLRLSGRTTAGFLIVVAALFASLWLSQIAAAISSGTLPAAIADLNLPTSPVYSLDLAFALPALAIAAGWLIRHDRRGPASALACLTFLVLLGLSVLAIFAVDAAAGATAEVAPIAIFGMVTAIAAVLLVRAMAASARVSAS